MVTLGQRLVQLRESHNIKQKDLADYLGITVRGLRYYETDVREPNIKTLITLANFFNVSLDYLLGITDIPRPIPANLQEIISQANDLSELIAAIDRVSQANKEITTGKEHSEKTSFKSEIEEMLEGFDEESMEELRKYIGYLRVRQTLSSDKDESSAGSDMGNRKIK